MSNRLGRFLWSFFRRRGAVSLAQQCCSRQPEPAQETELRLVIEERVNAFLEALQDPENSVSSSALFPDEEDHSQRSEKARDENGDVAGEAFDEDSIVSALAQVKQFLGAGSPIQNLRTGLRKFVLPSSGDADRVEMPNNPGPVPRQTPPAQEAGELLGLQTTVSGMCQIAGPSFPASTRLF
jgi:hypothetical protein